MILWLFAGHDQVTSRKRSGGGRLTFKGMDIFSSSDELAMLLHVQLASFLGFWRPMEDSLGAPRSARSPTGGTPATTYLDNGSRMLRSEKLDIAGGVPSKERHAGWMQDQPWNLPQ